MPKPWGQCFEKFINRIHGEPSLSRNGGKKGYTWTWYRKNCAKSLEYSFIWLYIISKSTSSLFVTTYSPKGGYILDFPGASDIWQIIANNKHNFTPNQSIKYNTYINTSWVCMFLEPNIYSLPPEEEREPQRTLRMRDGWLFTELPQKWADT